MTFLYYPIIPNYGRQDSLEQELQNSPELTALLLALESVWTNGTWAPPGDVNTWLLAAGFGDLELAVEVAHVITEGRSCEPDPVGDVDEETVKFNGMLLVSDSASQATARLWLDNGNEAWWPAAPPPGGWWGPWGRECTLSKSSM